MGSGFKPQHIHKKCTCVSFKLFDSDNFKDIQLAVIIDLKKIIFKVAIIQCFILIAVEIVHNIIERRIIRCCLIFFHPVNNSMLTRQWTHSGKRARLCMCHIVCSWRKVAHGTDRIGKDSNHWQILHENDPQNVF